MNKKISVLSMVLLISVAFISLLTLVIANHVYTTALAANVSDGATWYKGGVTVPINFTFIANFFYYLWDYKLY